MNNNELKTIEKNIDYEFNNKHLLQQAFVRRSYSQENGGENNEVLEFIGDKAIDIIVVKELMKRFGTITNGEYNEFKAKYQEGKLTEIKKDLVEKKMLAKCIDRLGFNQFLIVGKGDAKLNVKEEDSVKEDLFESIVGAVVIDSNWDFNEIEGVVKLMLDFNGYFNNKTNEIDYVGEVQKWFLKEHNRLPEYSFDDTYDGYRCSLYLENSWHCFSGEAKSKSGARFLAAKEVYEFLDDQGLLFSLEDEVGEPNFDRAINQLQELAQKGYIDTPCYNFNEYKDKNNNSVWECTCILYGFDDITYESSSKKDAKKNCAYDMLCEVMNYNDEYDDDEEDDD